MKMLDQAAPAWLLRREMLWVFALGALAMASIPVALGQIGLSWDALNHHIYLGWTAEHPRFDRDYLAASYQAYTYPYLYWPVYRMALAGWSGAATGVVLALIHALSIPAVWLLARACVPGASWAALAMRMIAVALAFMSGVVLTFFDSTGNDLMASIPFVWAVALAFHPWDALRASWLTPLRAAMLSGFFAGVSVAFKLSNGPLAVLLPALWLAHGPSWKDRGAAFVMGGVAGTLGFIVAYGYWGAQLWVHFGNPIYPFYDFWFEPVRAWAGWDR